MKLIKRCYGCGKLLYPWQNVVHTKLVGKIHKGCAFNSKIKYSYARAIKEFEQETERVALKALNEEETR